MRWILCGKNDAGTEALEFLVRKGDEVWAIGNRGDRGEDGWQRSFRAAAERLGVPFARPRKINAPSFVKRLAAYRADALLSIQYDQILRDPLFDAIGCPCLNLHFALLPRHRGVAPIAWAVLCGDTEAGVTLHHMIEDIDAGDVVAQKEVPIGATTTARELYDELSRAAVDLFEECYPFPPELTGRRLVQDPAEASYHRQGDFDFSQREVDWRRPASELHAWIRAMIFPPMQYPETAVGDRRLQLTRVGGDVGEDATAAPGTVVATGDNGLEVAAAGGTICVRGLRDEAGEDAIGSIRTGDRFISLPGVD